MASSNKDSGGSSGSTRGGTPEQHAEAGRQKAGNDSKSTGKGSSGNSASGSGSGGASKGTQGGSSEQHAAAGRQSHKNDK